VKREIETLLALQAEDDAVDEVRGRMSELEPRVRELNLHRKAAADALERARGTLAAEEKHEHSLQTRLAEQTQLHQRFLAQLDQVRKPREAAAAQAQVELTRKVLADMESEVQGTVRRVVDARAAVTAQEAGLAELDEEQATARGEISKEHEALEAELAEANEKRSEAAAKVDRSLLGKYDRLRTRRQSHAVFALRGGSCGSCDTQIPMQRRNQMMNGAGVDVCEGCGVLLYYAE
jgi:uncharacterized protein